MKKPFNPQKLIDDSPTWLKAGYVTFMQQAKSVLRASGALGKLDQKAKQSRNFHYLRSLLAIYDVPDLIALDIPWWSYAAIDYVNAYLEKGEHPLSAFEWGSGASTVWLAKRIEKVISVEHDAKWHATLQPFLSSYPNVISLLREPDNLLLDEKYLSRKMPGFNFKTYVTAIADYSDKFNIIIIDGRARNACLQASLPHLKPGGIIIFDNSNRSEYQQVIAHSGLTINRYKGKVPGSPLPGETGILT